MGIIRRDEGEISVLEAVQPVRSTALAKWVARGEGRHFVLKRLRGSRRLLTPEAVERLRSAEQAFVGKPYDLYFEWSDERIYCSELVWKVYKMALDLEIGHLQKGSDFDFSNPVVSRKVNERFPDGFPSGETVISPEQIFESDLLETVIEQ
jgi:hypothetical protein